MNTEKRNPASMHMSEMTSEEMARLVICANYEAVEACEREAHRIADAIDAIAQAFCEGHHLFYIGAGTSGRLGVLDAAECPPTFGVPYEEVQGIIAGGLERLVKAGENAEDIYENGVKDVENVLKAGDVLVGISAAGGAQYVIGALETAKKLGCVTVALTNNPDVAITKVADIAIVCDTGAEAITGSTRLKAGNTQKFVLNMLSTGAMIKTGKVYENLMINLKPSNVKLKGRVVRITAAILDCSEEEATALLERNDWNIRKTVEGAK
jgi:N-acetylmuramic acid 6-phosphate etherase